MPRALSILLLLLALPAPALEVDQGTTEPDPVKVGAELPLWRKECAAGRGFACGNIGALYALGKVVEQDFAKAYEHYEKACQLGQGMRCLRAGVMALNGQGRAKSPDKAVDLFARGCGLLDADSCVNYYAVTHGKTIRLDGETVDLPPGEAHPSPGPLALQQAVTTLTVACGKQVGKACGNLGGFYEEGQAVQQDYARARNYYERACELGEAERCARAGRFLANGKGGAKDLPKAAAFFTRHCELRKLDTCPLAHRARNRLPIDLSVAPEKLQPSTAQALSVLAAPREPAARKADTPPWATFPTHLPVVAEHLEPEVRQLAEACNRGDARACGNAGAALLDPSGKPRLWPETARQLFEKACAFGRAQRCAGLAGFHANGWGTGKSPERERAAIARACELGHEESCRKLK